MAKLDETLNVVSENIGKEIHSAVRKATAALKAQMQPAAGQT